MNHPRRGNDRNRSRTRHAEIPRESDRAGRPFLRLKPHRGLRAAANRRRNRSQLVSVDNETGSNFLGIRTKKAFANGTHRRVHRGERNGLLSFGLRVLVFVSARQSLFDFVGLPGNRGQQPRDLHQVGRVGQLVRLDD